MENHLKEAGFTLLSVILSFTLFLLLLSIITPILFKMTNHDQAFMEIEASQLFHIIENEVQNSTNVNGHNSELLINKNNGNIVRLVQKDDKIRRHVNGNGQEDIARNIQLFRVDKLNSKLIKIEIIDMNGDVYEKSLYLHASS